MKTILSQVRLPIRIVKEVDKLVKQGHYRTKSEIFREAIRNFLFERNLKSMIGSAPNTGDSVKEVREIRKRLSKEDMNIDEINRL